MAAADRTIERGERQKDRHEDDFDAAQDAPSSGADGDAMDEERETAGRRREILRRLPEIQRSREASSTIHFTSPPNEWPAWAASSGTSETSVMPGWVLTSRQTRSPSEPGSKRKSARLTPRQPRARCAVRARFRARW